MLKIHSNALCKSGVFFKTRTIQIRTTQNRTKQGPTVLISTMNLTF